MRRARAAGRRGGCAAPLIPARPPPPGPRRPWPTRCLVTSGPIWCAGEGRGWAGWRFQAGGGARKRALRGGALRSSCPPVSPFTLSAPQDAAPSGDASDGNVWTAPQGAASSTGTSSTGSLDSTASFASGATADTASSADTASTGHTNSAAAADRRQPGGRPNRQGRRANGGWRCGRRGGREALSGPRRGPDPARAPATHAGRCRRRGQSHRSTRCSGGRQGWP